MQLPCKCHSLIVLPACARRTRGPCSSSSHKMTVRPVSIEKLDCRVRPRTGRLRVGSFRRSFSMAPLTEIQRSICSLLRAVLLSVIVACFVVFFIASWICCMRVWSWKVIPWVPRKGRRPAFWLEYTAFAKRYKNVHVLPLNFGTQNAIVSVSCCASKLCFGRLVVHSSSTLTLRALLCAATLPGWQHPLVRRLYLCAAVSASAEAWPEERAAWQGSAALVESKLHIEDGMCIFLVVCLGACCAESCTRHLFIPAVTICLQCHKLARCPVSLVALLQN